MSKTFLSKEEKFLLLQTARRCIQTQITGEPKQELKRQDYPDRLWEPGASFVTLTKQGQLRGCIGALEPYQPLVQDVCEHAVAAATEDFRFTPVREHELPEIEIEVSRLTAPEQLEYQNPQDLVNKLRPGIDGVIIRDGIRRATFLPQVWEKIPKPDEFLSHLCHKMNASPFLWKEKPLEVFIYQVESFSEAGLK